MRPKHRVGAWAQIVVGGGVVIWWIAAAFAGIPELDEGRIDIWFHIGAELVMAAMLIGAGIARLVDDGSPTAVVLSGAALGALLYSSINSPGYFAERGEWWPVVMFILIAAASLGTTVSLRRSLRTTSNPTTSSRSRVRSGA